MQVNSCCMIFFSLKIRISICYCALDEGFMTRIYDWHYDVERFVVSFAVFTHIFYCHSVSSGREG